MPSHDFYDFTGASWVKSSYSHGGENGECVIRAVIPGAVGIADSTLGEESPVIVTGPAGWRALLATVVRNAEQS